MPDESCGLEVLRVLRRQASCHPVTTSLFPTRWLLSHKHTAENTASIFKDHHCHCAALSMRNGKRNSAHAELFGNVPGSAVQLQDWTSAWRVADFNTRPCDSARGSRAQRLHCGFFGSKARCKSLDRVPLALAIPNFSWREDLLQESIAKTGNRRSNAGNFADVNTCADDHVATGSALPSRRLYRDFESTDSLR